MAKKNKFIQIFAERQANGGKVRKCKQIPANRERNTEENNWMEMKGESDVIVDKVYSSIGPATFRDRTGKHGSKWATML